MENTNTTNLENSFLSRAVILMSEGMEMDEAIKTAFEQEQALALEMMQNSTDRAKKANAVIVHHVYTEAHVTGFRKEQNERFGNMVNGWEWQENRAAFEGLF